MSGGAALTGSLSDLPLVDLIEWVGRANPLGVIELAGGAVGTIVLVDGRIALASAEDGPTLAQMVIGSAAISSEGWDAAQAAAPTGSDLADALIDEGADGDLLRSPRCGSRPSGRSSSSSCPGETTFAYLPGASHALGGRFAFEPSDVIDEAQARVGAWKVIAEAIPSTSVVMRSPASSSRPPSRSPPPTGASWPSSTAARAWPTSSASLGMSAFAVCGVLHRLMMAGAVEATD